MAEQKRISKTRLLDEMHASYSALEELLASLSEEQMTTADVNGAWSVKDNLAHLAAWQRHEIERQEAIRDGIEPPDRWAGMSEDESNEQVYQQNKARPLAEVLAEFRSNHQKLLALIEAMTDEDLNKPVAWMDGRLPWTLIAGNGYEHYQEHSGIIQRWLASSSNA
jgi:hypothetical protein